MKRPRFPCPSRFPGALAYEASLPAQNQFKATESHTGTPKRGMEICAARCFNYLVSMSPRPGRLPRERHVRLYIICGSKKQHLTSKAYGSASTSDSSSGVMDTGAMRTAGAGDFNTRSGWFHRDGPRPDEWSFCCPRVRDGYGGGTSYVVMNDTSVSLCLFRAPPYPSISEHEWVH